MVRALEDAIKHAESLPEAEQEMLAAIIQAEIDDEATWQSRFSETTSALEKLVQRAKLQYKNGEYGDFPEE